MTIYDDMLKKMRAVAAGSQTATGAAGPPKIPGVAAVVKPPTPKPPKAMKPPSAFSPPQPPRGSGLRSSDLASAAKQAAELIEPDDMPLDLAAPELSLSPVLGPSRKEKDIELWKAWHANPSPQTLRPLMTALDPVIQSEVNRWAANAPRYALELKGRELTLEALKTYDPARGAALNTHVTHRLRKLSREVYTHADPVRLPENKQLMVISLGKAARELEAEHGIPPNTQDLAAHLGWSQSKVKSVRAQNIDSYIESQDSGAGFFVDEDREADDPRVAFYVMGLTSVDRAIFEHSTGWGDAEVLPVVRIAPKVGLSVSQVNTRKARMIRDLEAIL